MATKTIDWIDSTILWSLIKDARKRFTQIADECGVDKSIISNRYRELEKAGIIRGATIQFDYVLLGLKTMGVINFKVLKNNVDQCVEYLLSNSNVFHLIALENSHFYVLVTVKNLDKLALATEAIKRLPSATDVETCVWTGIRNIPENLQALSASKNTSPLGADAKQKAELITLDDLDDQIVSILAKDGRKPFTAIASELHVSTSTVIRKYEKLRNSGLMKCSIQVDPLKLGYRAAAIFDLALSSKENLLEVVDKLSLIPDVYLVIQTSGVYDLSVFSLIRDVDQLLQLKSEISKIAEISKMNMFLRRPKACHPGFEEQITTF